MTMYPEDRKGLDVIDTYSRQEAIEDGVLVDATVGDLAEVTRQHFKVPVAMTAAVWDLVEKAVLNPRHGNDRKGVWHDICSVLRTTISRQPAETSSSELLFRVIVTGVHPTQTLQSLKAIMGPDDDGGPCLTILLPEED